MSVTRAVDLHTLEFEGKRVQVVASDETGASETFMLRGFFQPGSGNPPHTHDREEVVLFLAGGGEYTIGAETFVVSAGDVVRVPVGVLHAFRASEETEAVGVLPAGTKTFDADGAEVD